MCHLLQHGGEHSEAARHRAGTHAKAVPVLEHIPKSPLGCVEGLDLAAITLWLRELASDVIRHISQSRTIPCRTIVEGDEVTPRSTTLAAQILRAPETATQPAFAQA